jgi:hypothetical protein
LFLLVFVFLLSSFFWWCQKLKKIKKFILIYFQVKNIFKNIMHYNIKYTINIY